MQFVDWIPAISTTSLVAGALWLSRKLIATRLTAAVKHEYDEEIEKFRNELRQKEELFKAELKAKESQIDALRNGALLSMSARQTALHSKKIEAVENLWGAVISLAPGKNVSRQMAVIKFEPAAKEAARDERVRKMFEMMGIGLDLGKLQTIEASKARPFLSPISWALYSAYSSIIFHSIAKLKMLQGGVDMADILETKELTQLTKVALPHHAEYIEQHGPSAFHYLLEELETLMLNEFKNVLHGEESDKDSIKLAAQILQEAEQLSATNQALQEAEKA